MWCMLLVYIYCSTIHQVWHFKTMRIQGFKAPLGFCNWKAQGSSGFAFACRDASGTQVSKARCCHLAKCGSLPKAPLAYSSFWRAEAPMEPSAFFRHSKSKKLVSTCLDISADDFGDDHISSSYHPLPSC